MKLFLVHFLALSTFLFTSACSETVDSTEISTADIYASIRARAEAYGTTFIETSLKTEEGGNTYLELKGDDRLTATLGGETRDMVSASSGGAVWYESEFDTIAENAEFIIAFTRSKDDGAPESIITLPAPFDISAPEEGANFVAGVNDIVIVWSNYGSNDEMFIELKGSCIHTYENTVDDYSGMFTIDADEIETFAGEDDTDCAVEMTLERRRPGIIDSNYGKGGEVNVKQARGVGLNFIL